MLFVGIRGNPEDGACGSS
jgi:hypothetical protein